MNTTGRWVAAGILFLLGVLLFNKGLDLKALGTNVDGDGIGLYFLTLEINDRVQEASIPGYSKGFFMSSFVVFLISFLIIGRNLKYRKSPS
ncbi:hypothetical protein [Mesobacillus sp. S13]|uniref:hypothetical protein n=1 Tax=Mesobacillus sp. S13 TaxID=2880221 RepID=UPI001CF39CD7|nr:hypothetical protein [Mesobacillus sp. S13]